MSDEPDAIADAFGSVSGVLWAEREALETLLFKLVEEQLVVTSGATRWLHKADAEVRAALDGLRAAEVVRAARVDALAVVLSMPLESTLSELAAASAEPWPTLLTDHRTALRALVAEIEAVVADNRRLLEAGFTAIRETLDGLGRSAGMAGGW